MDDNFDDLLGNNEMPVREPGQSLLSGLLQMVFYLFLLGGGVWACLRIKDKIKEVSEENHKKAVRRKYGIPDDNTEPFNVAYAKVEKKRKEERLKQAQSQDSPRRFDALEGTSSGVQRTSGRTAPRHLASPASPALLKNVPSERSPLHRSWHPEQENEENHFVADLRRAPMLSRGIDSPLEKRSSRDSHGLDERVQDALPEVIDEGAQDMSMDSVDEFGLRSPPSPRRLRGSKRGAAPVDEIENNGTFGRKAGKRSRRQSRKLQSLLLENENDHSMDLDHVSRGKKRDRVEAGSTFGGDDDSPLNGQGRRKTRRQKRKSEMSESFESPVTLRGTKRNFEVESTLDSEDDGSPRHTKMSRMVGRRSNSDSSGMSLDPPVIEPSCGGRQVGEEWQANGTLFRVGSDGRRQRQALLRRRRSRFSMPQDSQHPDSHAQLEVLIETWLNDDEFKAAEERGDVFTPDSDANGVMDLTSPAAKSGKQLLWGTPQKGALTPKTLNNALITATSYDSNPFDRPSSANGRRISLISDSGGRTSPLASPGVRYSKSYSKWEKQDLEAEAMAKLRKQLEEQKKNEPVPILKKVAFDLPPQSSVASATSSAPSSASAPSSKNESAAPSTAGFSFTKPSLPASTPSDTSDKAGTPAPSAPQTQFKVPTLSVTPPQPSKEPSAAPAAKAPTFSFTPTPSSAAPPAFGNKDAEKKTMAPTASTISFPSTTTPKNLEQKKDAPANVSSAPVFSFGAPAATSGTPAGAPQASSLFGSKAPEKAPIPAMVAPATNQPMFSFAGSKPTDTSVNKSPFGVQSAPTDESMKKNDAPAPATNPVFSFGQPKAPENSSNKSPFGAPSPASDASKKDDNSQSATPKFSFGGAGGLSSRPTIAPKSTTASSPFGSSAQPGASSFAPSSNTSFSFAKPASAPGPEASKAMPFGAAQGSQASSSPFGAPASGASVSVSSPASASPVFNFGANKPAAAPATSSPFGNTSSQSPFGAATGTSTAFGGAASKPDAPSPFGSAAKDAPKPLFGNVSSPSTGNAPSSGEKSDNKTPFSFNFGATSNNAPSTTAPAASNPFGNTSSAPTFNFNAGKAPESGAKPASNVFGASNFGAPSGGGSSFSFGSGSSPFGQKK